MIARPAPGSPAWALLSAVVAEPGEYAPRVIRVGGIVVAAPPSGGSPSARMVDRLREAGWIAPAMVRLSGHVRDEQIARQDGQARLVLALLQVGPRAVGELAALVSGAADPSGALEETLRELYAAGLASPPAALWPTEAAVALLREEG